MQCKSCKNEIPTGSVFCMYCGQKLVKDKKKEISVPKPKHLPSGSWFAEMMVNGETYTVCEPTEAKYYAAARAKKAGLIELRKQHPKCTLQKACRDYIDGLPPFTPPSSIRGYEVIYNHRCSAFMSADIFTLDWQALINAESAEYASKTVRNTWNLVSKAAAAKGVQLPDVVLPTLIPPDGDFLDFQQIGIFLKAIYGHRCELAALLALHSLRASEIIPLDASVNIKHDEILVRGASVLNRKNKFEYKEANKNSSSRRNVPILIPRLKEILPSAGLLLTYDPRTWSKDIKEVCIRAGLPPCSPHDLRRTFASLAYHLGWKERTTMLLGGWSTMTTVRRVYEKLAAADVVKDVDDMRNYYIAISQNSEQNSE